MQSRSVKLRNLKAESADTIESEISRQRGIGRPQRKRTRRQGERIHLLASGFDSQHPRPVNRQLGAIEYEVSAAAQYERAEDIARGVLASIRAHKRNRCRARA